MITVPCFNLPTYSCVLWRNINRSKNRHSSTKFVNLVAFLSNRTHYSSIRPLHPSNVSPGTFILFLFPHSAVRSQGARTVIKHSFIHSASLCTLFSNVLGAHDHPTNTRWSSRVPLIHQRRLFLDRTNSLRLACLHYFLLLARSYTAYQFQSVYHLRLSFSSSLSLSRFYSPIVRGNRNSRWIHW